MNTEQKIYLVFASLFGAISISLAAAAAHAVHDELVSKGLWDMFNKGIHYPLYAAFSLIGLAVLSHVFPLVRWYLVGVCWIVGSILFATPLLVATLMGNDALIPVTPVGGSLIIAGWGILGILAVFSKKQAK